MPVCPKCGYSWEYERYYDGFVKQLVHENIEYKCDFCGKVVHEAYARRNDNWVRPRGEYMPIYREKTYLCLECMHKYAFSDLLDSDRGKCER